MDTLTPTAITAAYALIKPHIHRTPLLTNTTLSDLASSPQDLSPETSSSESTESRPAKPKIRLFFKCENLQRIGAFKARGAFHAVKRLIDEMGNHAQALSLAATTFQIPAHIVMPSISTPSKISATQSYGGRVIFSGSTSTEREAVVAQVQAETGAILVPPYDHPDIILGQGTVGLEMEEQYRELVEQNPESPIHGDRDRKERRKARGFDAIITPVGGGGLNAGVATYFSDRPGTKVFGAEPSHEGADDCRRGLASGSRITSVKSSTIADGLRTPVGVLNWAVISDPSKVSGVYSVSEEQIKAAMRLVLERMKVVVEPSAVVGLAVVLYNEEFRRMVEQEAGEEGWDVGVVFSGGNTSVEVIGRLFISDEHPLVHL
ncbi:hypothetical protein VTN00DRAFT_9597 [Thermoascus crustaceus]|uniref:uncharacterized protein n=1 Tax=Thermoascus crustaceus TaxID=5088 RepID=UPI0037447E17